MNLFVGIRGRGSHALLVRMSVTVKYSEVFKDACLEITWNILLESEHSRILYIASYCRLQNIFFALDSVELHSAHSVFSEKSVTCFFFCFVLFLLLCTYSLIGLRSFVDLFES